MEEGRNDAQCVIVSHARFDKSDDVSIKKWLCKCSAMDQVFVHVNAQVACGRREISDRMVQPSEIVAEASRRLIMRLVSKNSGLDGTQDRSASSEHTESFLEGATDPIDCCALVLNFSVG